MSTRPRISFDKDGRCNACQWTEEKKTLDWNEREKELIKILNKFQSTNGGFDCIVPVSGGKDGSYVTYKLKHEYGMNPLAITVTPALSLSVGDANLKNFINSGFNHIQINPDSNVMRILNKTGFIEKGFPYYGWLMAIQSAILRMSISLNISLIFYGEDGEIEYGGTTENKNKNLHSVDYRDRIILEGGHDKVIKKTGLTKEQLYFFLLPSEQELNRANVKIAHWSYFENWDPYRNYIVAKEYCGLEEMENSNSGTFTNFAQNDQALYSLHAYMMYLKFGFGRATQDAGIEIRRGAMSRSQGLNLVRIYDGHYPIEFLDTYLDYYEMSQKEFDFILDKWVNKDLFIKKDGRWTPNFEVT